MISVIIPVFNAAQCIGRAIDSVLAQTFTEYEIIVINDGSTDGTADAVKKFGSRVNYIYQENSGVSVARNTGIAASKGDWIAFLDADDEWLPDKLRQQVELLDRNRDLRWCSTNRYQADERRKAPVGNKVAITKALKGREYFPNYFSAEVAGKCPIVTSAIVVRKDVFDELGGFEPGRVRGQDVDMWWRIAHYYPEIGYIPEPLAIRYLGIENPITRKHRLQTMYGHNRRELVARHLSIAKEKGSIDEFKPFASKVMRESIVKMLYCGYGGEARETTTQFHELFPSHWRLATYILTIFPQVTSIFAKTVSYLINRAGLRRKVTR
jgi:glycosyltransferase involved in cell wall biosynthesis